VIGQKTFVLGITALALGALGPVGCKARDSAADPSRPAVVKAPPVILPSDTAKPDTMASHMERMARLSRELAEPYALIAFGAVNGDRRLLSTIYAPDAVFVLGDSAHRGLASVVDAVIAVGRQTGLADWTRQSRVLTGHSDSTYVDSGFYVMRARRQGGPSRESRGTYVATWRHLGGPTPWVLLRDELKPGGKAKR
jgi:hypothetical protein